MNFAVFCSGQGTNLQAIIDAAKKRRVSAKLALVVCDNPRAYAIERARRAGSCGRGCEGAAGGGDLTHQDHGEP